MDFKTLKYFEKEIRTKINHELEVERKTNEDVARIFKHEQVKTCERISIMVKNKNGRL